MSRPVLALVLWMVFAATAFGWRTVVQIRRYGDSGWRIRPGGGTVAVVAHLSFVVSLVLAFGAPVAALVVGDPHRPGGIEALVGPGTGWAAGLGAVAMAGGSVLAVVAQVHMGASWRIGVDEAERTELVTHGLFRWVRNPIFTGMLVAVTGQALLVPNALALGAGASALVGLELQVRRVEEPYLVATHGEPYRTWAARTGRFLPGVGRLRRW